MVTMEVDTGASVSIVSEELFNTLHEEEQCYAPHEQNSAHTLANRFESWERLT